MLDDVLAALLTHLNAADPGKVLGLYLYGSAIEGLRADSDVDLLLLTRRALDAQEREDLTTVLMNPSGWRGHAIRFPEVAHRVRSS